MLAVPDSDIQVQRQCAYWTHVQVICFGRVFFDLAMDRLSESQACMAKGSYYLGCECAVEAGIFVGVRACPYVTTYHSSM